MAQVSLARRYREEALAFDEFVANTLPDFKYDKKEHGISVSENRMQRNLCLPEWTELPREGMAPTRFPTPRPEKEKKEEEKKKARTGPLRVLVLHGICSSGSVMKKQLARLQPLCKGKVELVYIDGPIKCNKETPGFEEMSAAFKNMEFFDFAVMQSKESWQPKLMQELMELHGDGYGEHLLNNPDVRLKVAPLRKYVELDQALIYLQDKLKEMAPIDGVLGFGAGANMAGLLAAQSSAGVGQKIGFAVMIAPGKPGYCEEFPDLFKEKIKTRSFHLSGHLDFTNPPHILAEQFEDPVEVMHEDGYRPIPGTSAQAANEVAGQIFEFIVGDEYWE